MIGKTLGHYQITERIGAGGMGIVYKARDLHLDRFVAIKVLPAEKVADPDRKRRFVQEAKAASALNHPNIITVHDITQEGGTDYIVMEYVEGKTLDQRIGHRGLRLNDALKYAVQIADALAKAHSAGIVHRDLKPTNIMVNEDGVVKVLDFGLAKLTEQIQGDDTTSTATIDNAGRPITEEGVIVGTVSYMSPEQAEGKKVDARSDIFSLGSVLYEMMTGQKAFQGTSKMSTLSAILHQEPKPVSGIAPAIPADFEKLITRCLRKDPERRFQHMDDVRVALLELKEDSDSGLLQAAPDKAKQFPPVRLVWVAGVVAAVAIAAVGVWFVRSRFGTQELPLTPVPLTSYAGFENGASFSPEGERVAFDWNGEKQDNWDIYIKLIGSDPPFRLTTNEAEESWAAWSPDGRQIAFVRDLGAGKRAVVLMSPLGGPERILTEVSFSHRYVHGPFLSWSPDGRALAVVEQKDPDTNPNLTLYMVDTGERWPLTNCTKTSLPDSCPAFSPDGRTLAFCRWFEWQNSDLYLLNLSQDLRPVGDPRRRTFHNLMASGAAWDPNGSTLVYSSGGNLWRVAASGSSQPKKLASVGQDAYSPAISHRASRLAFTQETSDDNIWRIEIPTTQGKANVPTEFISSTRNDWNPQYSPDGKRIAFCSERSGNWEIWICSADGSNAIQVTHFSKANDTTGPRWSPDSKSLAFQSNVEEGRSEIYVMNASGGKPRRLTFSAGSGDPSWSRDGQWVYFESVPTLQLCKMPAGGGPIVTLNSTPPGAYPVESSDGNYVYFVESEHGSLQRVSVHGGASEKVLGPLSAWGPSYAINEKGIYFIPRPDDSAEGYVIRFLELATGKVKTVAQLGTRRSGLPAVSPDSRWLLFARTDQAGSDLMLVENFR